jgi:hypothetical protein
MALFNGKDLTGWKAETFLDHRKLLAMTPEARAEQIAKWTEWRTGASRTAMVNDGKGAYATTERDFGDFELMVEYETVPKADSGIYLRGVPQVRSGIPRRRKYIGADRDPADFEQQPGSARHHGARGQTVWSIHSDHHGGVQGQRVAE